MGLVVALFIVWKHIRHGGTVLPTSLFNFEFYASNHPSVFAFEYFSNFGTLPTSLGIAAVTGKHHCISVFKFFMVFFQHFRGSGLMLIVSLIL